MKDLRGYIGRAMEMKGLSVDFEIARALCENPDKTLLFTEVRDYGFRVVGNVVRNRADIYQALGTDSRRYIRDVLKAYDNPVEPAVVEKAPCQEEECSLYDIPVLRHFEKDGGPFITAGIVTAKDPEHGRNASIHRLMVHDDNRLGIRIVPRHLFEYHRRAEERGEDLEVAISIGVHPALFYAASYSPPLGYDEFALAGALMGHPLEVVRCRTVDVEVPALSEFVIEGRILCGERRSEGPFADVTGTYDRVRQEPVIEVTKVTHRKDAIYQALLPSRAEHRLFMGMPQEPRIFKSVAEVAPVKNVCLTDGGRNWLHGVISLGKGERDIKKVIDHAFAGHPSMKHVIIVDDDIDIFDPVDVEFALATRFQGHRDAYIYRDMRGSTLDPSTDEDGRTTKVGIDATIPAGREEDYGSAKIP
ncbi:MAG: UbiD family decarboxylase [Methanobacteriota archaeon]|nr:MAG: UbiD family decarboxylase [Euryarchaeota archaeon]